MPKPVNIVLRNLTGGPTLGPPVKGATSPLISTALPQRDGTRDTGGETGGGGGEVGTPLPPPQGSNDPRFAGAQNTPLVPGSRNDFKLGTPDPLFTFDKFEYLGAFTFGLTEPNDRSENLSCTGFDTQNGTFFAGYNGSNFAGKSISELEIPATLYTGDDVNQCPDATVLQSGLEVFNILNDRGEGVEAETYESLFVYNDKLHILCDKFYDGNADGSSALIILDNIRDFQNIIIETPKKIYERGAWSDSMVGYHAVIPQPLRASFNNDTHILGQCVSGSIIGRYSPGHSFLSADFSSIPTDSTIFNCNTYKNFYNSGQEIPGFDERSNPVAEYYSSQIGMPWATWYQVPTGADTANQDDFRVPVTNATISFSGDKADIKSPGGAPYYGIYLETIIVKTQSGQTMSLNVDYTIEVSQSRETYGVSRVVKTTGTSIPPGENVVVTFDHITKRYADLTFFGTPGVETTFNDIANFNTFALGITFIPNTDTLFITGHNQATRFGFEYKNPPLQNSSFFPGGFYPRDQRDGDAFYWLFNVNDVLNGSGSLTDIRPYDYGVFDNNRFVSADNNRLTEISHSHYDPVTKRLYIVKRRVRSKAIVMVYKLNF